MRSADHSGVQVVIVVGVPILCDQDSAVHSADQHTVEQQRPKLRNAAKETTKPGKLCRRASPPSGGRRWRGTCRRHGRFPFRRAYWPVRRSTAAIVWLSLPATHAGRRHSDARAPSVPVHTTRITCAVPAYPSCGGKRLVSGSVLTRPDQLLTEVESIDVQSTGKVGSNPGPVKRWHGRCARQSRIDDHHRGRDRTGLR